MDYSPSEQSLESQLSSASTEPNKELISSFDDIEEVTKKETEQTLEDLEKLERIEKKVDEMLTNRNVSENVFDQYKKNIMEAFVEAKKEYEKWPDDFSIIMHTHQWYQQDDIAGGPGKIDYKYDPFLTLDSDLDSTLHPANPEYTDFVLQVVKSAVPHMDELVEKHGSSLDRILDLAESNPVMVLGNHPTWATILFTAAMIKIRQPDFDINRIKITLGPVATTFSRDGFDQEKAVLGLGDVLLTLPGRGRPAEASFRDIYAFVMRFMRDIEDNTMTQDVDGNEKGSIFMVAPSGTTDRVDENGDLYCGPIDQSIKMIEKFNKELGGSLVFHGFSKEMRNVWRNGGQPSEAEFETGFSDFVSPGEFPYDKQNIRLSEDFIISKINEVPGVDVHYDPDSFYDIPKDM